MITQNKPLFENFPVRDGFLWIGDPHLTAKNIGRRKDKMMESCFGKLEFCKDYAHLHNLRTLFGGDLLDNRHENNLELLNRLIGLARKFPDTPIDLGSNHSLTLGQALDRDAMKLLIQTETLHVVLEPSWVLRESYDYNGQPILVDIYGIPYGKAIPDEIHSDADVVVMLTHHDLAFGGDYPGSLPLKEIKGVDIVINGHMHANKKNVRKGQTLWCNPGNIEPLTVDLKDEIPRAWQFSIEQYMMDRENPLIGVILPHEADIFDMKGLRVEEASLKDGMADIKETVAAQSLFAQEILEEHKDQDAEKTSDASVLMQDIQEMKDTGSVNEHVISYLEMLVGKLVIENA